MKRRTGLLFSSAVALGVLGGTAAGFAIQQARHATPLPPLDQALTASARVAKPDTVDPATDDVAKLNGDLRNLLLDKPAGAKDSAVFPEKGWLTIHDLAEYSWRPDEAFLKLNSDKFRRAVAANWVADDGADVEVDLVQFRTTAGALDYFKSVPADNGVAQVPGSDIGYAVSGTVKDAAGMFSGYGAVLHGSVVELVYIDSAKGTVDSDRVIQVAKDQAGRL